MISVDKEAPATKDEITFLSSGGADYIANIRHDITADILGSLEPVARACEATPLKLERVPEEKRSDTIFKYLVKLEGEGEGKKATMELNHIVMNLIGLQLLDGKVEEVERTRKHFRVERELVEVVASVASRHNMIAGRREVMQKLASANPKRYLRQ